MFNLRMRQITPLKFVNLVDGDKLLAKKLQAAKEAEKAKAVTKQEKLQVTQAKIEYFQATTQVEQCLLSNVYLLHR